ncbi:lipopolysaccharide biosynthesis protein [Tsuneonella mangrovi]|uniref:lipopolysaccharide biosynthesis protein n=1 Tax=Tsuneonella mangrovi TaxID=1982042 RepID=UPI000BA20E6B|nr:oligosaccharide flippase family protein [Tsuneonella mangrovi]
MKTVKHNWMRGLEEVRRLAAGPIARASGLSMGIRLSGMVLLFVQAILTARLLGPAGYGITATVVSAAQVLSGIAMLGFGPLAVREIPSRTAAGEPGAIAAFLRFSLAVTLVGTLLVAALATLALVPELRIEDELRIPLALGGVLVMPLALIALMRGWAQGFGRVAMAQVPGEFLRPLAMVATMIAIALIGVRFTPASYVVAASGAAFAGVLAAAVWQWRSEARALPRPGEWMGGKQATLAAIPFLGLGLAALLQGEVNTLLLAAFAGPRETGLFQPVARLAPLLALPVQAATMRYAPRMAELWHHGEHAQIRSITRTFTWTTTAITLVAGLVIAGTGPWLMLVFGKDFTASAPLLWIVALAQVFNAACGPLGALFAMAGRTGTAVAGQLAGLAVNVAVGFAFIPIYGATAAACGILAATVTWNVVLLWAIRRKLGIDPSLLGLLAKDQGSAAT